MKKCNKCGMEKELSEFYKKCDSKDGLTLRCKICVIPEQRKYRKDNKHITGAYYQKYKDDFKSYRMEYVLKNKDEIAKKRKNKSEQLKPYFKEYRQKNRAKINEFIKKYNKRKRAIDPLFKMKANIVNRTSQMFKVKGWLKNGRTRIMLGASYSEVKYYLGGLFTEGMSWDNYGKWEIDHIIPLASAKNEEELTALCHYKNLQPLWKLDNIIKGKKIPENVYNSL
jgi:hypothetical protein